MSHTVNHLYMRWILQGAEKQSLDLTPRGRRGIETHRSVLLGRASSGPGRSVFTRNVCSEDVITPGLGKIFQITRNIVSRLNFWGVAHHQVIASVYTFYSSGS